MPNVKIPAYRQAGKCPINDKFQNLCAATSVTEKLVIPAEAGIQKKTGFRVKPGMTDWTRLISACIKCLTFKLGIPRATGGPYGHSS
jgi:hypothetical protein